MTPETLRYGAIMLAAGIGIPVLAALNAQLGARIGSPSAAAMILFVIAFSAALATTLLSGGLGPLGLAPTQPKHLFLAGLLVAFYLISITTIAPKFGVGNAVFFVLIGQMVMAALIDHFGLFGALMKPMTLARGAGIILMIAGVALIQLSSAKAP
ncbi:DMT family transporter [Pseudorhodobacter turbinis]|uniref:DMT family transporter n=1 Tax=Pseudorhodobacter turbinis TaxID=2500533 RepID=A0A4P8ECH4_9RHOB|nr:DMT family transporter [Pseudorhodobacter turbinis]QCO54476.1 DMT family transporter [Pseudorhodobacter turbinis]